MSSQRAQPAPMGSRRSAHRPLVAALCAYLVVALCYVFITPLWQAPDEPAHFNYVRYLAARWQLPVLQSGDYPAAYLEELKAAGFPPELSVAPIRYESHQPPLYYAVAAVWIAPWLGAPLAAQVYALRLLSVGIGAGVLLLTYCLGRRLWPVGRARALALAATGSLVPMHAAITASVNNDALAELVLIAAILCALRFWDAPRAVLAHRLGVGLAPSTRRLPPEPLLVGWVLGLCVVTKMTAFIALPLVLLCLLAGWKRLGASARALAAPCTALLLPVLLLGGLWAGRNMATYDIGDPLGQVRHDSIVEGQPRTADRLAAIGLPALLKDGAATTFRSFWGVFGWMGVPMHEQVYALLALVCLLAALGLAAAAAGHGSLPSRSWLYVLLLGAWALLSTAALAWYNLKFVQYQGRYLFVAMPAWAAALVEGLGQVRARPRVAGGLLVAGAVVVAAVGALQGDVPGFTVAVLLASAVCIAAWHLAGRWRAWLGYVPPLALLWLLSLAGALYYVNVYL